jgi:hypothetical protein
MKVRHKKRQKEKCDRGSNFRKGISLSLRLHPICTTIGWIDRKVKREIIEKEGGQGQG